MRWTLAGPGGSSSAGESRGRQLWRICDSRYPHLGTGFPPYSTRRAYSRISFLQCLELRAHLPCVRSYGGISAANASLGASLGSEYREGIRALEEAIRNGTTPQVREELFRHLGPTACIFAAPDVKKGAAESAAADLLIGTDDAAALGKALDAIAAQFNAYFQGEKGADGQRTAKGADNAQPGFALERLPAPDRGYKLISPAGLISWITADVQPTILIGKSYVAVANNPILARAALAAESRPGDRWVPDGELAKMLNGLPAKLQFLSVGNPRDSFWPEAIAGLPDRVAPFMGMFKGNAVGAPSFKAPESR